MMLMLANVVWPALLLGGRMLAVWPIVAGLFVEFFFVRYATNLRGWRCFAGDVAMNLASAVIGIFLIPLSGIVWELLASFTLYPLLNVGTFNPVTWSVTVLLAAGVNTASEGFVLRRGFKQTLGRRGLCLLFAANFLSVSIAFASILIRPPSVLMPPNHALQRTHSDVTSYGHRPSDALVQTAPALRFKP